MFTIKYKDNENVIKEIHDHFLSLYDKNDKESDSRFLLDVEFESLKVSEKELH